MAKDIDLGARQIVVLGGTQLIESVEAKEPRTRLRWRQQRLFQLKWTCATAHADEPLRRAEVRGEAWSIPRAAQRVWLPPSTAGAALRGEMPGRKQRP